MKKTKNARRSREMLEKISPACPVTHCKASFAYVSIFVERSCENPPSPGAIRLIVSSTLEKSPASALCPPPCSSERYRLRASFPTSTPISDSGSRISTTLIMTVRSAEVLGQPPRNRDILWCSPCRTTAKTAASASGKERPEDRDGQGECGD